MNGIGDKGEKNMHRLMRAIVPAAALAVAVGSATAASASVVQAQRGTAPGQSTTAVQNCGEGAALIRPASLILTCADDGELATHLVWSSWTASQASATGTVTWKNCVTMCADATKWNATSADITLTDPVDEPGQGMLFTSLTLNVTGATPAGFQRTLAVSEAPVPASLLAPAPAQATIPAPGEGTVPAAAPSGTLSYSKIEGYWLIAGGPDATITIPGVGTNTQAQIAAAITGAESSFLPGVIQPGVDYCGAGSDRAGWGLWQITCGNSVPKYGRNFQVLDPWNNAEAAVSKCKGDEASGLNCFAPWATWASGAYTHFLNHDAADKKIGDPGEYKQINATPPGTPSRPKADPGGKYGPPMPGTSPPKAAFSASSGFLLQEQPVTFSSSGSKAGAGSTIKSYSWNFGDGTSASGSAPGHIYVTSATMTVTLTVTDANGLHSSVSHSYFVLPSDSSAGNYVESGTTQEHLFYDTSAGALDQTWWTTKWANQALAGSPVTDPITLNYGTQQHVFYIASGGKIEQDTWTGSSWVQQTLPGTAASGSALGGTDYASGSTVSQHVFFTGSNGSLQQTYWNGKTWTNQNLPGKPEAGSPIVSSLYVSSGHLQQHVFFIGAGNTLQQTWYGGASWANQTLPGTPEAGQNSLATSDYVNNGHVQQHVFFIAAGGTLQQTFWTGTTWANQTLPGSPVLTGGLVTSDFETQQHIFWVGSGGTLWQTWYGGKSWADQKLPGTASRVLGTNDYPYSGKQQHLFFASASGELEQTWWGGKSWANQALPGAAVAK
jgi:PKD repeat protein